MKRPTSLQVLAKTYRVQFVKGKPLDEADVGEHDLPQQLITIRDGLHWQQEASALIHESLHAISDAMGIGLTEAQVLALESGLYALLTENPGLVSYISGKK
jgi:hypothetical protein